MSLWTPKLLHSALHGPRKYDGFRQNYILSKEMQEGFLTVIFYIILGYFIFLRTCLDPGIWHEIL